jgi:hypothetical protein
MITPTSFASLLNKSLFAPEQYDNHVRDYAEAQRFLEEMYADPALDHGANTHCSCCENELSEFGDAEVLHISDLIRKTPIL